MAVSFSNTSFTMDRLVISLDDEVSRKITLLSGAGALLRGTVVGKIALGVVSSAAKGGGNTGNGTLTVDVTTPLLTGAKKGVYAVRCISVASGTVAASGTSAAMAGNTTNDTITATPATGAGAQQGIYTVVCDKEAADGGEFVVRDPAGKLIGRAVVGTPFTTQLTFTIADGSTDAKLGDGFNITVGGEKDETFRVTDPDGIVLGDFAVVGVSGTATFAAGIKFAVADGATDFIVGDGFDVTVAAGSGKYLKSLAAAVDGSQIPDAILAEDTDASAADADTPAYFRGMFNDAAIVLGTGHTVASVREGLRGKGIDLITVQAA